MKAMTSANFYYECEQAIFRSEEYSCSEVRPYQDTRKERTHRLCTRGGMLEAFIREPSLLTDNDVMELLIYLFHGEAAQKKLGMLIERRRETAGRKSC